MATEDKGLAAAESKYGVWEPGIQKPSGYKVLVYGTSGSGKTYFAASFPKPLFVDLEGGMRSVTKFRPLRAPKDFGRVVKDLDELKMIGMDIRKTLLAGNAPFQTVVVDSLSEMQELVMLNILATYDAKRQYDDQPTLTDYGKLGRDFMSVFKAFLRLPCNVVFTNVVAPRSNEDEQLAPTFMGKKIGPDVSRLVDAIGFTHTQRTGKGEDAEIRYLINFANTPDHVGKDRLGIGPKSKSNSYDSVFKGATE